MFSPTIPSDVEVVVIPTLEQSIFSCLKLDNLTPIILGNDRHCYPHDLDVVNNDHFRLVAAKEIDIDTFSQQDFNSLGSKGKRKIFYVKDTDTYFRSVFYISVAFNRSRGDNEKIFTLFKESVCIADIVESQSLLSKIKGFSLDITPRMIENTYGNDNLATKHLQAKSTSIHSIYNHVTSEYNVNSKNRDVLLYETLVLFCSFISFPYHVNSALNLKAWKNENGTPLSHIVDSFNNSNYHSLQSVQEVLTYLIFPEVLPYYSPGKNDNFSLHFLRLTSTDKDCVESLRKLIAKLDRELPLKSKTIWDKFIFITKCYTSSRGLKDDDLFTYTSYTLWLNTYIDKNMKDAKLRNLAPHVDSWLVKYLWTINLGHDFVDSLNPYSIHAPQSSLSDFLSFKNTHFNVNRKIESQDDCDFLNTIVHSESSGNVAHDDNTENKKSKEDTLFSFEDNLLCCIIEHLAKIHGLEVDYEVLKEVDNIFYQPHMTNLYVCSILIFNGIISSNPQLLDNSENFHNSVRFVAMFAVEFSDEDFYLYFIEKRKVVEPNIRLRRRHLEEEKRKAHVFCQQGFKVIEKCAHTVSWMNTVCAGIVPLRLALDIVY